MNQNNGGPAFPVDLDFQVFCPENADEAKRLMSGMTLRDYFAAKAMQGFLANPGAGADCVSTLNNGDRYMAITISEFSYKLADAMLKAREAE